MIEPTDTDTEQIYTITDHLNQYASEISINVLLDALPALMVIIAIALFDNIIQKKLLPSLQNLALLPNNKSRPVLTPDEEAQIKEYMRSIMRNTYFSRVSLFFLDNASIKNKLLTADSFTLWIEATEVTPMHFNTQLSFAYVSEELKRLYAYNTTSVEYLNAHDGLICQVWLRDRLTIGYFIQLISNIGFLLLEQTQQSFRDAITRFLYKKTDGDYVYMCKQIEEIVLKSSIKGDY